MLKGIDPLISPDLLRVLAQMGHGDEIVVADSNFPSVSVAARTVTPQALRMDCDVIRALRAVLSLLPLDGFEPDSVLTMQIVGDPDTLPPPVVDSLPLFSAEGVAPKGIERFAFYDRAKAAFAVLQTAEPRPYACFILRKGVIFSSS